MKCERRTRRPGTIRGMLFLLSFLFGATSSFGQLLKVGVVGLNHDHAHGILNQFQKGKVILLGIAESNPVLIEKYKALYHVPDSVFFKDTPSMLAHIHPDAVLAYNAIADHLQVVEACAPKGISVMVEKPLATTLADAERMQTLALRYHIQLLTNYETTWYSTNQQINSIVNDQHGIGNIRKMVAHDGHEGPQEIGCSKEFLRWLTDPVKNGGGAVMDFGCYGANLMTWLMHGKQPIAVTATLKQIKPAIYPKVDDDATIVLEYADATGIIEASWNWPFGIKDLEVFGQTGYLHARNDKQLDQRIKNTTTALDVQPAAYTDNLVYLAAILRGELKGDNDLSSLNNNLIVIKILEAAKQSAKEGKRIVLRTKN